MNQLKRSLFLCACFALFAGSALEAATVTITWNRNPEPQVTGYRLSIGIAPGVYTQVVDVGNTLSWSSDVNPFFTYYFALQAYDAAGNLSAYSAEVTGGAAPIGRPRIAGEPLDAKFITPPDLFWQHENGWLSVWSMDGATKREDAFLTPDSVKDSDWRVVGTGDFNRDLVTDLVWHHRKTGEVAVWQMDGRSRVKSVAVGTESDLAWALVAVGDMNGDTDPDLIWQHRTTGSVAVWFMDGTTYKDVAPIHSDDVNAEISIVGVADFNHDGHSDLLLQRLDGSLSAWLMTGVAIRAAAPVSPSAIDPTWHVAAVADYNQDGHADVVFRKDDGHLAMWFMNGVKMTATTMLDPSHVSDLDWKIVGPR